MSFFNPQVSFRLNFATPFSVMTHNSSESFQLKQYMLWTKTAHQCTIFRLLGALLMKIHPILPAIFETTRSGFFKFRITVQCHERKLLCIFQLKPHIFWTKIAHRSGIFRLLSGWVKIHEIPHVIFETASLFSLNFASLFNVTGDESSVFFS